MQPRGPKPKTHCKHGHELTLENARQTFKDGAKNGRKCKLCACRLSSSHRERFPEKAYRGRIESQMRCRYGIVSLQDRDAILASQGNKCAACGISDCTWGKGFKKKWHIDHVHDGTANYRGILCSECNLLLGQLVEQPDRLEKLKAYLRKFTATSNNEGESDEEVDTQGVAWGCGFALERG